MGRRCLTRGVRRWAHLLTGRTTTRRTPGLHSTQALRTHVALLRQTLQAHLPRQGLTLSPCTATRHRMAHRMGLCMALCMAAFMPDHTGTLGRTQGSTVGRTQGSTEDRTAGLLHAKSLKSRCLSRLSLYEYDKSATVG